MIYTVIIFLPLVLSLFWMFFYLRFAFRTDTLWEFISLMFVLAMAEFSICAYYDPSASWRTLLIASNLSQLFTPCLIPLLMIYLHKLRTGKRLKTGMYLWVFIPVILFTIAEQSSMLAGRDAIELFLRRLYTSGFPVAQFYKDGPIHYYYVSAVYFFRATIILEVIVFLVIYIKRYREDGYKFRHIVEFLKPGKPIDIVELQYINLSYVFVLSMVEVFMFRDFLIQHQWISIVLSFLMVLFMCPFCYTAFFGVKRIITLKEMNNGLIYNYDRDSKITILGEIIEEVIENGGEELKVLHYEISEKESENEAEQPVQDDQIMWPAKEIYAAMMQSRDEQSLTGRFERLMTKEQFFLQPGLTLIDVAEKLNTNKTYISKLVNNNYNMPFPDLINILRIDYAEEYLVSHRDATQADIAKSCGFPSASSFNNTFKKVTGMTPRIWLATYDSHQANSTIG